MNKRERAKHLLFAYFVVVYKHAGLNWSEDNTVEIENLVDCLIDAAKEELQGEEENNLHAEYKQRYNL